ASSLLQLLQPGARRLPSLERLYLAGSFAPRPLVAEARERLCPDVRTLYGATEVGPVACAPLEELAGIANAVGIVAPDIDVECVDDSDNPQPPGVEGAIRIRRNPDSSVYLDAPDASQAAFRGEWFYPGDFGILSKERVLVISGRVSDVVNVGGDKRTFNAIEEEVRSRGDVVDVAAFTVPDAFGVPQFRVAVVAGPSLQVHELAKQCLEASVVPPRTRFLAVAAIPRNDFGKIVREALPALAAAAETAG
ncbi:MAG TPA: AMP-binding protein, partial [Candidatus Cybelea sp.]|nr:AMP-binding protein [Candidatus Cybelea sp.]